MITPKILNRIFDMAMEVALFKVNKLVKNIINLEKGVKKIKNINEVIMLKNIEKWANFLLSLLLEKSVNKASKLVPILAPKIKGSDSVNVMIFEFARICKIAINKLDDCRVAVSKVPIIRLKNELFVADLI